MQDSSKPVGRLSALTVANYRSFPTETRLRLAPLTLLYGWNNSGKSALLRMLTLVGHAVGHSALGPLDLSILGQDENPYSVFWSGDPSLVSEDGVLIGLEWDDHDEPRSVKINVDYSSEKKYQYVRSVRLENRDGSTSLHWRVDPEGSNSNWFDRIEGPESPGEVRFEGLVPPEGVVALAGMRKRMLGLRERIQWLRAVRAKPPQSFTALNRLPPLLKTDGSDAARVLSADAKLKERVAEFYDRACNRRLEVKERIAGQYSAYLTPNEPSLRDVLLLDTGDGMAQSLPVLVAGAMAERLNGPQLLVIEEPESHLQPKAQRPLVEFLCEVAKSPNRPTLVIETHSNALMLSVQVALARGILSPEQVCAYWLEPAYAGATKMTEVTFAANGNPNSEDLMDIFSEESRMSRELSDRYADG